MLDDQHAENHLHGRGGPPSRNAVRTTMRQVGSEVREELVVLKQSVQLGELRIEMRCQWDEVEQVHRRVAVAYHGARAFLGYDGS